MELLILLFVVVGGWQILKRVCLIMDHLEIEDPAITERNRRVKKQKAKADAKAAKKAIKNARKEAVK